MFGAAVYLVLFLIVQGVRKLLQMRNGGRDKRLDAKLKKEEVLPA